MNLFCRLPRSLFVLLDFMTFFGAESHAANSYVLVPLTNVWKYDATVTN